MLRLNIIFVPALLLGQLVFVRWAAGEEHPPVPPNLSAFPVEFSDWKKIADQPVDAATVAALGADQTLSANYAGNGASVELFVAWFRSQRGGASQPHSPQVCLPASGWVAQSSGVFEVPTAVGAIEVNRYVITNGRSRAVVLYWYQTPRGGAAGEWASKLQSIRDAVLYRRTDTSLVRVIVWSGSGGDDQATTAATGFVQSVYPLLRRSFASAGN